MKGRSGSDSTFYHRLTSTGLTQPNYLSTNSDDAEGSVNDQISALASTHFQVKAAGGGGTNLLGSTYVAWAWNAGSGTSVTNTSGSITSQVSANPTAGVSVVTYTGTGSAGATVGHGLGAVPSMIIFKRRNANANWQVYHTSLGNANSMYLHLTNGSAGSPGMLNSTTPTSTLITLGTSTDTNPSTGTMVAYCFAPIAGYSAFSSYTGNLSTNGPFVHTGFRPAFILFKSTASSENWIIFDTTRSPYNVTQAQLYPNLSNAEDNGRSIDILSNGFKIRDNSTGVNDSGVTYIYMAFASNPFKYSLAR